MLQELLMRRGFHRALWYALFLLIFELLQELVFSRISILGVRPLLPPLLAAAVGLFEGGVWGGVFGLCAGLWMDGVSSDSVVLFTVLCPLLGFLAGFMTYFFMNRRFFSFFLLSAAFLCLIAFCQAMPHMVRNPSAWASLFLTGLLQTLWSLPFVPLAYFPVRRIAAADLLAVEREIKLRRQVG